MAPSGNARQAARQDRRSKHYRALLSRQAGIAGRTGWPGKAGSASRAGTGMRIMRGSSPNGRFLVSTTKLSSFQLPFFWFPVADS